MFTRHTSCMCSITHKSNEEEKMPNQTDFSRSRLRLSTSGWMYPRSCSDTIGEDDVCKSDKLIWILAQWFFNDEVISVIHSSVIDVRKEATEESPLIGLAGRWFFLFATDCIITMNESFAIFSPSPSPVDVDANDQIWQVIASGEDEKTMNSICWWQRWRSGRFMQMSFSASDRRIKFSFSLALLLSSLHRSEDLIESRATWVK